MGNMCEAWWTREGGRRGMYNKSILSDRLNSVQEQLRRLH